MKQEWEERGTEDPYHWVMTDKRNWDKEEYYTTGKEHVDMYITPLFAGVDTSKLRAIDIGCGTGRMTRYMKFGEVIGLDISPSMIEKAKVDNPDQTYIVTDGVTLKEIPDNSVDFAFSYATLQHFTRKAYLKTMLHEIHRVLVPGGTARIHVRGLPGGLKGVAVWWKSFDRFYIAVTKVRGIPIPFFRFYDTVRGVCVKEAELAKELSYFEEVRSFGKDRFLWFDLKK
jgi:SAM-dependent methyltransferase